MGWNGKSGTRDGVIERGFDLEVKGHRVPGVYGTPAEGGNDRLVLFGHGGTVHKYIENVARLLAARGIAAMAIDGPGHGERAQSAFDANDTSALAQIGLRRSRSPPTFA